MIRYSNPRVYLTHISLLSPPATPRTQHQPPASSVSTPDAGVLCAHRLSNIQVNTPTSFRLSFCQIILPSLLSASRSSSSLFILTYSLFRPKQGTVAEINPG